MRSPRPANGAVLLALAGIAGAAQRGAVAGAPGRVLASGLAMLVVVLPLVPRHAHAAIKGDVTNDGRVDVGDVMLLLRHVNQGVALPVDPSTGDVAPFSIGALGDGLRNSADVLILTRGITEADIDGDGLSPNLEAIVGTSPLVVDSDADGTPDSQEDSDQDGVSNVDEVLATTPTDPGRADTDGDGIVDSRDATPTVADGARAVWVHADHLGSVAVVSNQAGNAVRRIAYDTWGSIRSNVVVGGAASLDMAEKYTGQRFDAETSLYYYGARYYDSALGRFTRTDAVIASHYRSIDSHPYAYVRHSPLNFVDPTGNLSAGGGGGSTGSHPYPDRGDQPRPNIIDGLNWLWQGAIDRALAMWAAMPKAAPPGPQTSVQEQTQTGPSSYIVSRPLGGDSKLFSHNFIVTDAEYVGDPNAKVFSYGDDEGFVGRVDENTEGFSEGTYAADVAAWEGMKGSSPDNPNLVRIPASSDAVRSAAGALIENQKYSAVAGPFGANSNSAAQAVGNRAAGTRLKVPGSPRIAPGSGSWREIEFRGE